MQLEALPKSLLALSIITMFCACDDPGDTVTIITDIDAAPYGEISVDRNISLVTTQTDVAPAPEASFFMGLTNGPCYYCSSSEDQTLCHREEVAHELYQKISVKLPFIPIDNLRTSIKEQWKAETVMGEDALKTFASDRFLATVHCDAYWADCCGAGSFEEVMTSCIGDALACTDDERGLAACTYCASTSDWDASWEAFEDEVIQLVNVARAQGGNCGANGEFGASQPLTRDPALTCAARNHSQDMSDKQYFSHENGTKRGSRWRIGHAGYDGGWTGENIAYNQDTPAKVVQAWLESDGHCANIHKPEYRHIGVGYVEDEGNAEFKRLWTQNFGG